MEKELIHCMPDGLAPTPLDVDAIAAFAEYRTR
jgi:hypothetical protein